MTRINAAIRPKVLSDKHLQAEFFELPRVLTYAEKFKPFRNSLPQEFTLGPGHVKFFAGKLMFLHERYMELYKEMKARGFNVDEVKYRAVIQRFRTCDEHLYHNWRPTLPSFFALACRLIARQPSIEYRQALFNSEPYGQPTLTVLI